jgi:hypothetical protein
MEEVFAAVLLCVAAYAVHVVTDSAVRCMKSFPDGITALAGCV